MDMIQWMEKARSRGCPLLAIETPEPAGVALELARWAVQGDVALLQWDCLTGLEGEAKVNSPARLLVACQEIEAGSIVLAWWHPSFLQDAQVVQGVLNLREPFKASRRTLVILGRDVMLPASVRSDFLVWHASLPGSEDLGDIVDRTMEDASLVLDDGEREKAIDVLRGMSGFEAEQHVAMALCKGGIDFGQLWQAKVAMINSTPGLQYWAGAEVESDMVGLDGLKEKFYRLRDGRLPVRLVVWIDESEDALAGVTGDLSGVSQDALGAIAKHMVDTQAQSMLLAGHPGTGKSHSAKVSGSLFKCPVLALDLGACKGSLVGQSEAQLRQALAIERAIVGGALGSTLWVWTTNAPEKLPGKILDRQRSGRYFHDLPGEQEALAIWSLHRGKYQIDAGEAFPEECEGWTGREIENCCRTAWQFGCSLSEAGEEIIPAKVSQAQVINERRRMASGNFLDPVHGRVYCFDVAATKRKITV